MSKRVPLRIQLTQKKEEWTTSQNFKSQNAGVKMGEERSVPPSQPKGLGRVPMGLRANFSVRESN